MTYFVNPEDLGADATVEDALDFAELMHDVFVHEGVDAEVAVGSGPAVDADALEIGQLVFDIWSAEGNDLDTHDALVRAGLLSSADETNAWGPRARDR